jgi:hypothetical protein
LKLIFTCCFVGNLLSDADVSQKLRDWGPYDTLGLAALPGPDGSAGAAAAAGAGLDALANRQMARTAAATGAATLLTQTRQQLDLLECCCAIVLLHFLQVRGASNAFQDDTFGDDFGIQIYILGV